MKVTSFDLKRPFVVLTALHRSKTASFSSLTVPLWNYTNFFFWVSQNQVPIESPKYIYITHHLVTCQVTTYVTCYSVTFQKPLILCLLFLCGLLIRENIQKLSYDFLFNRNFRLQLFNCLQLQGLIFCRWRVFFSTDSLFFTQQTVFLQPLL